MTVPVVAVYAGIVVSDVGESAAWYRDTLDCTVQDEGDGWSCLVFPDNSTIELFAGNPARAGDTFPSYGGAHGPPVMPGYAVDDPEEVIKGLRVTRSLPDWYVVVAPDGLRVVVTHRETAVAPGLVGFRFASPAPAEQRGFLDTLGVADDVVRGSRPAVVPVVKGDRSARLVDPDGTSIDLDSPVS